jgi:probable HAF family extracellular repeat protein
VSRASRINNLGQIVGVAFTADGRQHATMWTLRS